MTINYQKFSTIALISLVFGLLGAVLVMLAANWYFGADLRPQYSSGFNTDGQVVIQGAKNVVVEQDNRLADIAAGTKSEVVGIYRHDNNDYVLIGQGLMLTSDGWLVAKLPTSFKVEDMGKLTVVSINHSNYQVSKLINDDLSGLKFLKISNAKDLNVAQVGLMSALVDGQLVAVFGFNNGVEVGYVNSVKRLSVVKSSDLSDLKLIHNVPNKPANFVFKNLADEAVGVYNDAGNLVPMEEITAALPSILAQNKVTRAYLGINFIDPNPTVTEKLASGVILSDNGKTKAVAADSPMKNYGLKAGDLILAVDGVTLDDKHHLTDIILAHRPNDTIYLKVSQNGQTSTKEVLLGGK